MTTAASPTPPLPEPPPWRWQEISPDDYARFQRLMDVKVRRIAGVDWMMVRPLFYRPLWPFQSMDDARIVLPAPARLGAAQYPVKPGAAANSYINHLCFLEPRDYSVESLARKPRKQVRLAAGSLSIRAITDVAEFKAQAYSVYQSFHDRTRYSVGDKRRDPAYFAFWADQLFAIPGVLVLGGYQQGVLRGVSLTFQLGDTVNYASFFCDTPALKLYLPDLMLHAIRAAAAHNPGVNRVYVGLFKGVRGLDEFKLLRGASLFRQPAHLAINPLLKPILRTALPKQHRLLLGYLSPEQLTQTGLPVLPD